MISRVSLEKEIKSDNGVKRKHTQIELTVARASNIDTIAPHRVYDNRRYAGKESCARALFL